MVNILQSLTKKLDYPIMSHCCENTNVVLYDLNAIDQIP